MTNRYLPTDLLVVGGGGHAKVVIDVARAAGYTPVAALDPGSIGSTCNGVPVVGDDNKAGELFAGGLTRCAVAIGDNKLRLRLGERLDKLGFDRPALVHPSAVVSPSARLGNGTIVMPLAVVNAAAVIGELAIINTSAVVEHDCMLEDGCHVAPGTRLGGCVSIGRGALIGIGSTMRPQSRVGDYAVVGAGSTVIADVPEGCVAVGSPARVRGT